MLTLLSFYGDLEQANNHALLVQEANILVFKFKLK